MQAVIIDSEITELSQLSDRNQLETMFDMSCDSECQRFKELFYHWPETKPRGVIYILTQSERMKKLKIFMNSLHKHFTSKYHYPLIIFHENDMLDKRTDILKSGPWNSSLVFFQTVNFSGLPKHVRLQDYISRRKRLCNRFALGYRHMCYFHAKIIYELPILDNLEYAWRLDDDSVLMNPIKYDIFQYMKDNNFLYGYKKKNDDHPECVYGLWETVKSYVLFKGINATLFNDWPYPQVFYNNFEISSLRLWMSKEYKDYIAHLDAVQGMFTYRWGDAPVHTLAVTLFVKEQQLHYFDDIKYKHKRDVF